MKEYLGFRLWLMSKTAELMKEYVGFRLWLISETAELMI
jgi:hypothetical protein